MALPVTIVAAFFTYITVFLNPFVIQVSGKYILEEGYTVTTILDGHKLGFNPHSVLPQSASSDLIILDSSSSSFYTVSFSNSPGVVKKLSGNGIAGYSDGDLASAMFNKPRSFAVDQKNNVYVADKKSHTIRKISISGVTTIAGGFTKKTGNTDGPAQNASFSDDFELSFVPGRCALMISDRGNQLVRQINLKAEDCASGSDSALGTVSVWALLGLGVACLLGLIIGFTARPYVLPYEGSRTHPRPYSGTWKRCLINLGKQVQTLCSDIKSVTARSNVYGVLKRLGTLTYSHMSLMFGVNLVKRPDLRAHAGQTHVSLLDCDVPSSIIPSNETIESRIIACQLETLVGSIKSVDKTNETFEEAEENMERSVGILPDRQGRIDKLIQANIMGFAQQDDTSSTSVAELPEEGSGLFMRRLK